MIASRKARRRRNQLGRLHRPLAPLGGCGLDSGVGRAVVTTTIVIGISLPLTGDFSEPGKGVQRGYEAWAEVHQRERRPARQAGRAEDPRRPVQRRPGRLRLREADQPGRRSTWSSARSRPGWWSRPPRSPRTTASSSSSRPVRPRRSSPRASTTSSTPRPRSPTTTTTCLAENILAMPDDQRPKTVAYAAMDDPFAKGTAYGLKDKLEEAGIKTVVDEVYPPNTTDFGSIAAQDRRLQGRHGGRRHAVPGRGQPDRRAAAARTTSPSWPPSPPRRPTPSSRRRSATRPRASSRRPATRPTRRTPSNKEFVEYYTELNGTPPAEDEANAWTTGQVVAAAVEAADCADPCRSASRS